MSAAELSRTTQTNASAFSVLGTYHQGGRFVCHASLLGADCIIPRQGAQTPVRHMCPPVHNPGAGHDLGPTRTCTEAHVIGWLDLTDPERAAMATALTEVGRDMPAIPPQPGWSDDFLDHYVLVPPVEYAVDVVTGRAICRRCSCVGFVLECYREGLGFNILAWSDPGYPTIDLPALVSVYTDRYLLAPRNLARVGLGNGCRWPVALPGHLLHALTRSGEEVRRNPYLPRTEEEAYFPSRSTDPLTAAEHAEAERRAYFRALNRGGGVLPPYDAVLAVQDFCEAAGEVIQERPAP